MMSAPSSSCGRSNNTGRRAWWYDRNVDSTLREYGYCQRICGDLMRIPLHFPQAACIEPVAPALQRPPEARAPDFHRPSPARARPRLQEGGCRGLATAFADEKEMVGEGG
jgi:hypothetical protein